MEVRRVFSKSFFFKVIVLGAEEGKVKGFLFIIVVIEKKVFFDENFVGKLIFLNSDYLSHFELSTLALFYFNVYH